MEKTQGDIEGRAPEIYPARIAVVRVRPGRLSTRVDLMVDVGMLSTLQLVEAIEGYSPLRIEVGEYGQVIVQKRICLFWMSSVVVVIGQEGTHGEALQARVLVLRARQTQWTT